jgi:copper homeostasis protein
MSRPNRILIEVAIESPDDAVAAEAGGADRLELCAALDLGGLTPTIASYHEVRETTRLPIVVMIRPRGGDFVYSNAEFRVMAREIELFIPYQPDAFVFGLIGPDGSVDTYRSGELVRRAGGIPCVYHRAFDRAPDAAEALEAVIPLGFARILTSGGETSALGVAPAIANLVRRARGRIELLPCGQLRAGSAADVVRITGCNQVHGSFAEPVPEEPGRGYRGYQHRCRTSRNEVAFTRQVLDRLARGELD